MALLMKPLSEPAQLTTFVGRLLMQGGLPQADNAATMLHIDISEGHSIRER